MEDMEASSNPKEVFAKMMKNPEKFMKIVKRINERFQEKMKRGDISQEEIMKEAGDMLKKLKEMGGNSKEMNDMFKNMAKSMGQPVGKNTKVDVNAMNRMMKSQDIKDRLRAKMAQKQAASADPNFELQNVGDNSDHLVYRPSNAEPAQKTMLSDIPKKTKEEEAAELDKLVAEIESAGTASANSANANPSTNNKKKAKKKK